jgi:hypothetical protein
MSISSGGNEEAEEKGTLILQNNHLSNNLAAKLMLSPGTLAVHLPFGDKQ